jgi:hypothetical protein
VNDEYTVIYWVSDYGIAIWIDCFTESFSKTALNIIAMRHLTTVGAARLNDYYQEQPRGNLPLKKPSFLNSSLLTHLSSLFSPHSSLISHHSSLISQSPILHPKLISTTPRFS